MIKQNQRQLNQLNGVLDAFVAFLAMMLAKNRAFVRTARRKSIRMPRGAHTVPPHWTNEIQKKDESDPFSGWKDRFHLSYAIRGESMLSLYRAVFKESVCEISEALTGRVSSPR